MYSSLVALFPLIIFIMSGYFLKRKKLLEDGFWHSTEKLNYYVLFPALLFNNLATAEIHLKIIQNIIGVLLAVLALCAIVLAGLKYLYSTPSKRYGVFLQSQIRFNTYIGLAIIATLLHSQGMTIFAILIAIAIPIVNVMSVMALTQKDQAKFSKILLSILKNPLILACIVGASFNVLNIPLWEGMEQLLKQVGACSLPLGLLCVGAALQFTELKKDVFSICLNTFTRLMLVPAVAYAVCQLFAVPTLETQVLVIFFALPTASASYILTKVLGGDSQLMAGIISLQTLCAAVTLPMIITWLL